MARNAEGQAPHKWRGKWRASITIGYNSAGKQKRKYCYGKTRQECVKLWNKLKIQNDDGTLITEETMSVASWFEHWIKVKETEISARTIELYGYNIQHILPYIGRAKLNKLTAVQVQRMQINIAADHTTRAAFYARKILHNALEDALVLGLVSRNVAAAVKPIKYETEELKIWTAKEVRQFLTCMEGCPYYALFYTAITTGMRSGELMGLHWSDIEQDKLHIKHNISIVGGKPILTKPKTKRSNRVITLAEDTVTVLAEHKFNKTLNKIDSELVFTTKTGNYLCHSNLNRSMKNNCKRAEVTRIRVHDLRHTFASMRIANGCDVVELSRDLGHANASFTLNIYAHFFEKHQARNAPSLKELLGEDKDD